MENTNGVDYFSRDGTGVLIYNMDAGGSRPIHGAYYSGETGGWIPQGWDGQGRVWGDQPHPLDIDWESAKVCVR